MRLWHNSLIELLPKSQLLGQWRELNSIFKLKNKHILINFVYDYPAYDLYCYSVNVIEAMSARGYRVNMDNMNMQFAGYAYDYDENYIPFGFKMNDIYLKICVINLYEKYLCGGIGDSEWNKIYNANKQIIDDFEITKPSAMH